MSNWDLMMPGMGLTAIGLAGVVVSYSGIAHTFIDGMHALTGLTMFVGLIFLSAGILEGGVSTSNRAKATTLVVIAIGLSFGAASLVFNTISTIPTFAALLMILAIPAIVIAYVSVKLPQYTRPVGGIFALAAIAGVGTFVAFGLVGPDTYLIDEPEVEAVEEEISDASVFQIAMLEGSAEQGNPDYDPDVANVPMGHIVEWVNEDAVSHTATSSLDFGETFDTGLLDGGESFRLDTGSLAIGEYEYLCIVHPWMVATLVVEEPKEAGIRTVSIPVGAGIKQPGQVYYDPEVISVAVGTTVSWTNDDVAIHTVTANGEEFDSEIFSPGEAFDHTFDSPGSYDYICIVHPWMVGTVNVE